MLRVLRIDVVVSAISAGRYKSAIAERDAIERPRCARVLTLPGYAIARVQNRSRGSDSKELAAEEMHLVQRICSARLLHVPGRAIRRGDNGATVADRDIRSVAVSDAAQIVGRS